MTPRMTIEQYKALPAKKKLKYCNKKVVVDGITFHSKREANRYCVLKLLVYAGEITDLRLQPEYPLRVNGHLVCTYRADFEYTQVKGDRQIVEDCKGYANVYYKLKKKLMRAVYGIEILET